MDRDAHEQGNAPSADEVNLQLNNQGSPELGAPPANNEPAIASPAAENSNSSFIILGTSSDSSTIELSDTDEPFMVASGNNSPTYSPTDTTVDPNNVIPEGELIVPGGNVQEELNNLDRPMSMNNFEQHSSNIRPNNWSAIANNNAPNSLHHFGTLFSPALSDPMQQNNATTGSLAPGSGELLRLMAGNNWSDIDFNGTEIGQLPLQDINSEPEIQTSNNMVQLPLFPGTIMNQNDLVRENNLPISQHNFLPPSTIMAVSAALGFPNLDFSTLSFAQLISLCELMASSFAEYWARSVRETTESASPENGVLQRALLNSMVGNNISQQQRLAPNRANGVQPRPRPAILSRSQLGLCLPRSVISSASSSDARSPAALQGGGNRSNGVVIRDRLDLGGPSNLRRATHPQENGESLASSAKRPRMEIQVQPTLPLNPMVTQSEENSNEVDPYSEATSTGSDDDQWAPNGVYDPEYERRGLPVDPFLRKFALSDRNKDRK